MRYLVAVSLIFFCQFLVANPITEDEQKIVQSFINIIRTRDHAELSTKISFPLKREQPLSDVQDSLALAERYHEVFDDSLSFLIINSSLEEDWSTVGWRGIMFKNGLLWLDYGGKLIGVNYQSEIEKFNQQILEKRERDSLHTSINDYKSNYVKLTTDSLRIRIDVLANDEFRYVSWSNSKSIKTSPMEVINGGKIIYEGTGGNYRLLFNKGQLIYNIEVIVMGEDNLPPARLNINKNGNSLMIKNAIIVRN